MEEQLFWELTEDELDKLAAHAKYMHDEAHYPYQYHTPWGELSDTTRRAWMNAVAGILITLDVMGKTAQTVVIDYD